MALNTGAQDFAHKTCSPRPSTSQHIGEPQRHTEQPLNPLENQLRTVKMEVWNQRLFLLIFLVLCIAHVLAD
jgi:hypothetical protein